MAAPRGCGEEVAPSRGATQGAQDGGSDTAFGSETGTDEAATATATPAAFGAEPGIYKAATPRVTGSGTTRRCDRPACVWEV